MTITDNQPAAGSLAADPAWASVPPEMQGAFTSKGWHTKTPLEAAMEAVKSYQEVEKHIGIPKDQIARIPKDDNDKEGWAALNRRLGAPEAADKYDFSKIKNADGGDLDADFVKQMKETFFEKGISASKAEDLMAKIVKATGASKQDEAAAQTAKLLEQKELLKTSWGPKAEANKFIASQAVLKLGLDPETVEAIEKTNGYAKTMEAFLKMGMAMGESKFVSNDGDPAKGVMTREQAQSRLGELKNDDQWVSKLNAGDVKANQEHDALLRIITAQG